MSHNSPIASEGVPLIIPPAICGLIAAALGWAVTAVIFGMLTFFVIWFFRNPERQAPENSKFVISPADGRVIRIEEVDGHELLDGPLKKISIFMNVFNVHVNRAVCDGQIEAIRYYPGKFFSANLDKASKDNERNAILFHRSDGRRILAVQIAGLIARRIVCWVTPGTDVKKGERFGLIRFGSRLDVYVPPETSVLVRIGDKVRAGESPLGELT
ncbi:MAG: phosphatidylserine decarboxylase family protein [Syntrophales bacterium]|nr:phosphatidylserine decarboxylase family protein [Syntrophales bacterium]